MIPPDWGVVRIILIFCALVMVIGAVAARLRR